jgi:hypothetical protein
MASNRAAFLSPWRNGKEGIAPRLIPARSRPMPMAVNTRSSSSQYGMPLRLAAVLTSR